MILSDTDLKSKLSTLGSQVAKFVAASTAVDPMVKEMVDGLTETKQVSKKRNSLQPLALIFRDAPEADTAVQICVSQSINALHMAAVTKAVVWNENLTSDHFVSPECQLWIAESATQAMRTKWKAAVETNTPGK